MSYEEFDRWVDSDEHIKNLTEDMIDLVDECVDNPSKIYDKQDLEAVRDRMSLLIEQGVFWLERDNNKRYIYDLEDFVCWLCEFMEEKENYL